MRWARGRRRRLLAAAAAARAEADEGEADDGEGGDEVGDDGCDGDDHGDGDEVEANGDDDLWALNLAVTTGGQCTRARQAEAGYELESQLCARCGKEKRHSFIVYGRASAM